MGSMTSQSCTVLKLCLILHRKGHEKMGKSGGKQNRVKLAKKGPKMAPTLKNENIFVFSIRTDYDLIIYDEMCAE